MRGTGRRSFLVGLGEGRIVSRILVVDDEAGMRDLLRILLEKEGHEVLTAGDGATGLALAMKSRPEIS